MWRGELRAFSIPCRCKRECLDRMAEERAQREKWEKTEIIQGHTLSVIYISSVRVI